MAIELARESSLSSEDALRILYKVGIVPDWLSMQELLEFEQRVQATENEGHTAMIRRLRTLYQGNPDPDKLRRYWTEAAKQSKDVQLLLVELAVAEKGGFTTEDLLALLRDAFIGRLNHEARNELLKRFRLRLKKATLDNLLDWMQKNELYRQAHETIENALRERIATASEDELKKVSQFQCYCDLHVPVENRLKKLMAKKPTDYLQRQLNSSWEDEQVCGACLLVENATFSTDDLLAYVEGKKLCGYKAMEVFRGVEGRKKLAELDPSKLEEYLGSDDENVSMLAATSIVERSYSQGDVEAALLFAALDKTKNKTSVLTDQDLHRLAKHLEKMSTEKIVGYLSTYSLSAIAKVVLRLPKHRQELERIAGKVIVVDTVPT